VYDVWNGSIVTDYETKTITKSGRDENAPVLFRGNKTQIESEMEWW